MYGPKSKVCPYGLFPEVHMGKKVRVPCVYNYPLWGIWKLTIYELATLFYVPLLLQDKLDEIDKKFLLAQFLSSVPGKEFLLASDYLISSRIWEGWCSMLCIDLKVDVQDTVIQQVMSASVPSHLPMMEEDVVGAILKAYGQKEDDAAPLVALWDSWFYRSWKVDRAMVHPLEENWQHLLGIFWKFSLRWWKHRQLRSCIAFGKRYQSSSHITHRTWIKGQYVSHINKCGGVDTQQIYKWSGKRRDCYIIWSSQWRGLITILKECYLPIRECMKRISN